MRAVLIALLFLCRAAPIFGAEDAPPRVLNLGRLTLNQIDRVISFPAAINMTNGLLEYALVHKDGKVHESLLATETKPHEIHAAMLLLNATSTNTVKNIEAGGQIENPAETLPQGTPVEIFISWQKEEKAMHVPLSSLIYNEKAEQPLRAHPWVYNGSRFSQGRFLAELSGSILSLITDLDALANNIGPDRIDDTIWKVNTQAVPPLGTAVDVTLKVSAKQNN